MNNLKIKTVEETKPIIWFDMNHMDGRESLRQLPAECIEDCSGSGDKTDNVKFWVEELNFDGSVELFKEYLEGFGAWDDEELKDHEENKERVLWTWACNCDENPGDYDYLYLE
tara:strand:+ start:421 stop:759 length:339 start_codon:yes stop_codon:yes gene_type:complete